jgi:hypothetical protein
MRSVFQLSKRVVAVMRIIGEQEFYNRVIERLATLTQKPASVTGPGRSGAIASVYVSHILGIPWIPMGQNIPLRPLMVVDTAARTGATVRRLIRKTGAEMSMVFYDEPPLIRFWYERGAATTRNMETKKLTHNVRSNNAAPNSLHTIK